ncbi:MlaD family protein [Halomonas sp. C05BenzN]|uniref:MlaD family protein n=1 Tax=Halomonas sp. C05BenzN TaxID=3411041 RepID=UPI003B95CE26
MQTRVNPALVGAFVLGLVALLVVMVVWLAGERDQQDYLAYRVMVEESVAGLSERATVTYRGVEVGFVERIDLSEDLERVVVTLRVAPDYRLRQGTSATLRSQVLTGRTSVELSGGEGDVLDHGAPQPPMIAYQPSRLFQLDQALGEVLDRVDVMAERIVRISERIDDLLSDENRDSTSRLLTSVSRSAERIERLLDDDNIESFQATLHNLEVLTARLERFSGGALEDLDGLGDDTRDLLASLRATLDELSRGAGENLAMTGEQVRRTLGRFDALVEQLGDLTRELEQNPGQLLFGPDRHPPGPGER